MMDKNIDCPNCNKSFTNKGIGHHWRQSSCDYPKISKKYKEIFIGLFMGDGMVQKCSRLPVFRIGMINKPFLDWLDNKLEVLTTGVRLDKTAEESAKQAVKSGFRPNAKPSNYHNYYKLNSRGHKWFNYLYNWYNDNGKVFDRKLKLTPTIVKMWYCSDGCMASSKKGRNYAQIKCSNESERIELLKTKFNDIGFNPTIPKDRSRLSFSNDEIEKLLKYMGEPPKGFEYKWVSESQGEYLIRKKELFSCLN